MISNRTVKLGPMQPTRYVIPMNPLWKDRTRGMVVKNKSTGKLISVQRKTGRSRAYENWIQETVMQQHPTIGAFSTRLSVSIAYYTETLRGDIDNLTKATLDGMNKGIWTDDTLIDELYACRIKAPAGVDPQTVVLVRPVQHPLIMPDERFQGQHECPMCGTCLADGDVPF